MWIKARLQSVREDCWERVPEWDADEVEICSRTGYGFYFLYGGWGGRFPGFCYCVTAVYDSDFKVDSYCRKTTHTLWTCIWLLGAEHLPVSSLYQYRNGTRINAGNRYSIAFLQLWRLFFMGFYHPAFCIFAHWFGTRKSLRFFQTDADITDSFQWIVCHDMNDADISGSTVLGDCKRGCIELGKLI